jgi:hypothetical protein
MMKSMMKTMMPMMSGTIKNMEYSEKEQMMDMMMPHMMANMTPDEKLQMMQKMMPSMLEDMTMETKMTMMQSMMPLMMQDMDMAKMMPNMMATMLPKMQEMRAEMEKTGKCVMADAVARNEELKTHMGEMMFRMCPQMAGVVIPKEKGAEFVQKMTDAVLNNR